MAGVTFSCVTTVEHLSISDKERSVLEAVAGFLASGLSMPGAPCLAGGRATRLVREAFFIHNALRLYPMTRSRMAVMATDRWVAAAIVA
jgi:hypothetical protein